MIEIINVSKNYGNRTAVSNLNINLMPRKIYGLLGPNGAGKTTTLNIITGCLAATDGRVLVNGFDILKDAVKAKQLLGYLPETPPLYSNMTVEEYLKFVAMAKGLSKSKISQEISEVMAVTGIENVKDRLIKFLSKGYCQRVGIAQAILGKPEYIILDEPTVGLDPNQITEIRNLIRSLTKESTVILSSHILSEISNICDEILVISNGKLVASDTSENLIESLYENNILCITAKFDDMNLLIESIESIDETLKIDNIKENDGYITVNINMGQQDFREKLFFKFSDLKAPIVEMTAKTATLEEVFAKLTLKQEYSDPYIVKESGDKNEIDL